MESADQPFAPLPKYVREPAETSSCALFRDLKHQRAARRSNPPPPDFGIVKDLSAFRMEHWNFAEFRR